MKYFVIVEVSEHYDDEWYSFEEGGTPIFVSSDKAEAQAKLKSLIRERIAGDDIMRFCEGGLSDLTGGRRDDGTYSPHMDEEQIQEKLPFLDYTEIDDYQFFIPNDLTEEQYATVIDTFPGLRYFELVEVDQ